MVCVCLTSIPHRRNFKKNSQKIQSLSPPTFGDKHILYSLSSLSLPLLTLLPRFPSPPSLSPPPLLLPSHSLLYASSSLAPFSPPPLLLSLSLYSASSSSSIFGAR